MGSTNHKTKKIERITKSQSALKKSGNNNQRSTGAFGSYNNITTISNITTGLNDRANNNEEQVSICSTKFLNFDWKTFKFTKNTIFIILIYEKSMKHLRIAYKQRNQDITFLYEYRAGNLFVVSAIEALLSSSFYTLPLTSPKTYYPLLSLFVWKILS